jgi:antitoxin FitA
MAAVTIRNLSWEAHLALKVQAAQHNRGADAEMCAVLEDAVRPEIRLRIGTALSRRSRAAGWRHATRVRSVVDPSAASSCRDRAAGGSKLLLLLVPTATRSLSRLR